MNLHQFSKEMIEPVLLIGYKGSIGNRYRAILEYLSVPFYGVDLGDTYNPELYKRAIIATSTETHFEVCKQMIAYGINFLCEKPVSKNPEEIKELIELCEKNKVEGNMVCNWKYVRPNLNPESNQILYNNFHTGKDGVNWDCIQLHYLDEEKAFITTDKPFFASIINNKNITYFNVEDSYIDMMKNWINNGDLWTLEDALKATEKVIKIEEEE
jgi:hypothetical protein